MAGAPYSSKTADAIAHEIRASRDRLSTEQARGMPVAPRCEPAPVQGVGSTDWIIHQSGALANVVFDTLTLHLPFIAAGSHRRR